MTTSDDHPLHRFVCRLADMVGRCQPVRSSPVFNSISDRRHKIRGNRLRAEDVYAGIPRSQQIAVKLLLPRHHWPVSGFLESADLATIG